LVAAFTKCKSKSMNRVQRLGTSCQFWGTFPNLMEGGKKGRSPQL
jgi:hypothetical protein